MTIKMRVKHNLSEQNHLEQSEHYHHYYKIFKAADDITQRESPKGDTLMAVQGVPEAMSYQKETFTHVNLPNDFRVASCLIRKEWSMSCNCFWCSPRADECYPQGLQYIDSQIIVLLTLIVSSPWGDILAQMQGYRRW
jgi:hypothetical protein